MGVTFKSDFNKAFARYKERVHKRMDEVGVKAVSVAKATGDYQDHTGKLRSSNYARREGDALIIGNYAPYADYVEAKGFVVSSEAYKFAVKTLQDDCHH